MSSKSKRFGFETREIWCCKVVGLRDGGGEKGRPSNDNRPRNRHEAARNSRGNSGEYSRDIGKTVLRHLCLQKPDFLHNGCTHRNERYTIRKGGWSSSTSEKSERYGGEMQEIFHLASYGDKAGGGEQAAEQQPWGRWTQNFGRRSYAYGVARPPDAGLAISPEWLRGIQQKSSQQKQLCEESAGMNLREDGLENEGGMIPGMIASGPGCRKEDGVALVRNRWAEFYEASGCRRGARGELVERGNGGSGAPNPEIFQISSHSAFLQRMGDISGCAEAMTTKNIPLVRSWQVEPETRFAKGTDEWRSRYRVGRVGGDAGAWLPDTRPGETPRTKHL
ncbi:hypothetical protein EDD16DRAFT_1529036 [Pisolithus croceorrhizus]|nr:hypothetical protein EDD16DRAFT_1529036 [Pisolithus croceorrhizus]